MVKLPTVWETGINVCANKVVQLTREMKKKIALNLNELINGFMAGFCFKDRKGN